MKKISTLFQKDPNDLGRVINEINPENQWVFDGKAISTQKFDGTSCAIINRELYRRYDAKNGKLAPQGAIPCQEADQITGHHPHWVKCINTNPEDIYFFEGFANLVNKEDGTYELCGPKLQANPEKLIYHQLIKHGSAVLTLPSLNYHELKEYLSNPENDMEGIVFHHKMDERMCKLRKKDFGIKRE